MTENRSATHSIEIEAPPRAVYDLVADAGRWPVVFGPTVHVDVTEHSLGEERFNIWAMAKGEVANWSSRRTLDAAHLTIDFRQERSVAPIASMGGRWEFAAAGPESGGGAGTEVLLRHDFTLERESPESLQWIMGVLDQNSGAELRALKSVAELGASADELIFSFEETVSYQGELEPAYRFVYDCAAWPRRLPHVAAVELVEETPGIQHMKMETVAADGTAHSTASVRVCTPSERIVYKQTELPKALLGHSGTWRFTEQAGGKCSVTSQHLVMLDPREVAPADLAAFREQVAASLARNSRTTLEAACEAATRGRTAGARP
ncbi:aromatase/cyclase [Streptomyces tsukubensis]|uniref:Coenzyme Q-binding protein COQ10 START domain-containing protein n=1 Tax=Streptomyces tsukubensis TaxID=83656 RepID=A0A1V4AER0_9ACTN|nr:aromatase/cyclase [Streptomyces tsukubensis]OON82584.1 hypothetical protein B1H18_00435 [Streptomyces tsukubensis]QFR92252.1 cyclase [Streptomyces tsukubensis]